MVDEEGGVGKKSSLLKEDGCLAVDRPETAVIEWLREREREGERMDLRQ
jgi:hypothetical protein